MVLAELFKRFARAISYTYFRYDPNTTSEEKYHSMNMYLLSDEDLVEEIGGILNNRNDLAHIFIDDILDFIDNNFFDMAKKAVMLYEVIEKYVEYVNKYDPSKTRIRKIYLE
ncbi:hypothetical protein BpOF4_03750 [Alkalihalophilus pseudofirmus OF4]|uniref:MAE-28990/MAE-18760-like HEPN domain-containing protein n=1 Tax=Alkalihalophilus pseudofirmus (strain ATCC BAA-2126 / JCM 17055 / OF4) TaxID=398511 RepID=D3FX61_ALKPO|nr:hypothetical protein BpOF4_03750 [Alkalihalophilus pseudofirmus OF4]